MEVQVVFFDAAGTLLYPEPTVGEVYARALRRCGQAAEPEQIERRFGEVWSRMRREVAPGQLPYGATRQEARAWWRRVMQRTLAPFGEADRFEEVFEYAWGHFAQAGAWALFDGALPTLEALRKRGKETGLISNWDVRLGPLLDELGLRQLLDHVVISYQVGVAKPGPGIFRAALRICGHAPQRTLHVGDNYEEDVLGARRAGMRAVLVRRNGKPEPPPDAGIISSLPEVLDLVD